MCVVSLVFPVLFFFFRQKTAYELRISDWSSYVCSSDLRPRHRHDVEDDPRPLEPRRTRLHVALGERDLGPEPLESLQMQIDRSRPDRAAAGHRDARPSRDRKTLLHGKSVSVWVDLGGRRTLNKETLLKLDKKKTA